jgi:Zn-finger nucleic acid-binding protein
MNHASDHLIKVKHQARNEKNKSVYNEHMYQTQVLCSEEQEVEWTERKRDNVTHGSPTPLQLRATHPSLWDRSRAACGKLRVTGTSMCPNWVTGTSMCPNCGISVVHTSFTNVAVGLRPRVGDPWSNATELRPTTLTTIEMKSQLQTDSLSGLERQYKSTYIYDLFQLPP